jgi:hypothetical protein
MATPNQVPRANEEGEIGTSSKNWLKGWFKRLFVGSDGIVDVNEKAAIKVEATATAVNYITIKNAATGNGPQAKAEGTDTPDIDFVIKTKGVGKFQILDGNDNEIAEFHAIASAVNFLKFLASATGVTLTIQAIGTDTNIDITLTPKGTGKVKTASGVELTGTGKELLMLVNTISFTEQVLTSAADIAWDLTKGNKAILVAGHNFRITITKPSGAIDAVLIVTQDGTGTRVMDDIITRKDDSIAVGDVDVGNDRITIDFDCPTGARIEFATTDTMPGGLSPAVVYWAIRVDSTHIEVASSKANAIAGTKITITDQGVGTHTLYQLVKWPSGTLIIRHQMSNGTLSL